MENTKQVTIGAESYQLGRLSARDGSWVAGQFVPRMFESFDKALDDKTLGLAFAACFAGFSEETFNKLQAKCLGASRRMENGVARPMLMADGREIYPLSPLEATALLVHVLVFNLRCFFEPGARAVLGELFPTAEEFLREPSTPTS